MPMTLRQMSASAGVSPYQLQRTFKRLLGITPRQYADSRRLDELKAKLRQGRQITPTLYDVGYGSSSRLYERAPGRLGMTPATYRRGGRGTTIRYVTVASPLGRLLVARTALGICSIKLGESDQELEAALRSEYPQAEIRRRANGLGEWVRGVLRHLEGRQPRLDLPLDVRGTAFQRRVWDELARIPYGSTRSYAEIARALGRPAAARAVARACAQNPVPLVVPCHRVVRSDGKLGGYAFGVKRKRTLLETEEVHSR